LNSTAHKLQDEWLLSYAAGALDPARSLMVSSHIAYHDDLQEAVSDAESIGGALLESMQTADVSDTVLDELMGRLDKLPAPAEVKPVVAANSNYPEPIREFFDGDLDSIKWRFMGPGIRHARLWDGPNGDRLWLLRARGGVSIPEHGHTGDEWTLLLKGSYTTNMGRFGVGDIDLADEEIVHQPMVDKGDECVCLVLTEGPIRMKSLIGRMIQPLVGI
jgi:putative transcriptional regulator